MNLIKFDDNLVLPGKLNDIRKEFNAVDVHSVLNSNFNRQRTKTRTDLSLYSIFREYLTSTTLFIGKIDTSKPAYVCERQLDTGITEVVCVKKQGNTYQMHGTNRTPEGILSQYMLTEDNKTALMFALMPILLDDEISNILDNQGFLFKLSPDASDWEFGTNKEDLAVALATITDNILHRTLQQFSNNGNYINLETTSFNNGMRSMSVQDLSMKVVPIMGSPNIFEESTAKVVKKNDFRGSFKLSDRKLSDIEKLMVPNIAQHYIIPDEVYRICEAIKESSDFPSPMRTFLVKGPAGTGKTELSRTVAAGLEKPYDHYTCHPNTEIFDFLGQLLPGVGSSSEITFDNIRKMLELPTEEDIINDPNSHYEKIMGEKLEGAIADESVLIRKMIEQVLDKSKQLYAEQKDFIYVESPFIKALRNGWCFEVQEVGSITRAGVVVGLNALLESGDNNFITLPTGEFIKKDSEAVIIFTSNEDYEGCANLNQSVLSRMAKVFRMENPKEETMKNIIKARTGFNDDNILMRMINVIKDITLYCKQEEITDGVCGLRELENWVMSVIIRSRKEQKIIDDELVKEEAIETVINKVSQDIDCITKIQFSVLDKAF